MLIRLYCGKCGKRFRISSEHAGQQGKCSRCGNFIPIPKSSFNQVLFRLFCDVCGNGIKSPLENAGKTISCPKCDAKIKLPLMEKDGAQHTNESATKSSQKTIDLSMTTDAQLLVDIARHDIKSGSLPNESKSDQDDDTFDIELVDEPNHNGKDQENVAKLQNAPKQVDVELDDAMNGQARYNLPDEMENAIDKLEEALKQSNKQTKQRIHGVARVDVIVPRKQTAPRRRTSNVSQVVILIGGAITLVAIILLLLMLIIKYNS